MDFDYKGYSEIFSRFLLNIEKIDSPYSKDFPIILKEVANFLRIGKLDSCYYRNFENEKSNHGDLTVYLQDEDFDSDRTLFFREVTAENSVVTYKFFAKKNSTPWTEIEEARIANLSSILYNYTGRANMIKIIDHLKNTDAEFNIPNALYFHKEIRRLHDSNQLNQYGICFFNLKKFAIINKKYGREQSTKFMKIFISDLQKKLGSDSKVGRMGGDNFLSIFRKDKINQLTEYLKGTEIDVDGDESKVLIKSSTGIYMIPDDYHQVEQIFENGYMSLQAARNRLDTDIVFYDDNLRKTQDQINSVEDLFVKALEQEEFQVYFQPKVMLSDYRLTGAEALCRWQHNGKLIPPNDFIPILEQSNNICLLDFYMLEHVCRNLRRWIDEGKSLVTVSVNLSRRHMGDHRLLEKIINIIDKYKVPHEFIEIELTETTTDVEFNDLKQIVFGLHNAGIKVSVDDFGVGYSSLNLIRQIPWDVIKIDKSFLPEDIREDTPEKAMLCHMFSMLQDMGFKCIVEGIETLDQVRVLKENNCYYAQGYYFDKPLPVDEFEKRLVSFKKIKSHCSRT